MRSLPLFAALACTSLAALAQSTCSAGPGPATTIATRNPFAGSSLYGHPNYPNAPAATYTGFSYLFDAVMPAGIALTGIDLDLYDAGGLVSLGNNTTVTSPNQVGATTNVDLFLFPGPSWIGAETAPSQWSLMATGTLTVGQSGVASPTVFSPAVLLPPGTWGIAVVVYQTTTGPNPGPLHPMLDPATLVPETYSQPGFDIVNLQFQRESWTPTLAPPAHTQMLMFHYNALGGYSNWTAFGSGCGAVPPALGLDARPVLGTTVNFQTTNMPAGSLFGFTMLSFFPSAAGTSLSPLGWPGCSLYLQLNHPIKTTLTGVSNGVASMPLAIPNTSSLSGISLSAQTAPLAPAAPGGLLFSNAVCVGIGQL